MRRRRLEWWRGLANKTPADALRNKILASDFSKYPGDTVKFYDESLHKEGLLKLVRQLESDFATQEVGEKIEAGMVDQFKESVVRRMAFRWLCLLHRQNQLRFEEIGRLRAELAEQQKKNWQLRDELSEGTSGFVMKAFAEGRDVFSEEYYKEEQQIRHAWRERKKKEREEESKRRSQEFERKRKRSGRPPSYSKAIDWTKPHTEQEFVDAFADKHVHVKKVRKFLRRFMNHARRRGRGRNKPLEFPFEAGIALCEEALANWMTDDEKRSAWLFATATQQVSWSSALSEYGLRFREVLARLSERTPLQRIPHFSDLIGTEEGWRAWHQTIREHGCVSEGVPS